ncbi:MAG: ATP-binding protein [Planctomycetota bacterium]
MSSDPAGANGPRDLFRNAIDVEREQIGHELHDVFLPLLFAASANIRRSLQDGPLSDELRSRLAQAADWIDEAQLEGRQLLIQLHPPQLEQGNWLHASRQQIASLAGEQCEVVWTIDDDSAVTDPKWDQSVAAAAYRILGEAARNAVRHGDATLISIRCQKQAIWIVDDGCGFDADNAPTDRHGIKIMKRRAELIGGKVEVQSEIGGPTKVNFQFPP